MIGVYHFLFTVAHDACHIGADIHEMSNAVAAFTLGIAFEELADLEEEHHEDRLGELGLCTRQEANAECTDGSHRHEEMLVEGIAVGHALNGFVKRFVSDEQIGYEINKEQLPCG